MTVLVILVVCLTLVGCSGMSLSTLSALSKLDPLETHPSELDLAVAVPDEIILADQGAVMRFAFKEQDKEDFIIDETFELRVLPMVTEQVSMVEPDQQLYHAKIDPDDWQRLTSAQQAVRQKRSDGIKGSGMINIQMTQLCYRQTPPDILPFRTFIRTRETGKFVPLSKQEDLFELLDQETSQDLRLAFQKCDPSDIDNRG